MQDAPPNLRLGQPIRRIYAGLSKLSNFTQVTIMGKLPVPGKPRLVIHLGAKLTAKVTRTPHNISPKRLPAAQRLT